MAEIRLNKILRQYNIGLRDLVEFLRAQGLYVAENPNAKVSEEYLSLIHAHFLSDRLMSIDAKRTKIQLSDILDNRPHPGTEKGDFCDSASPEIIANINLREKRNLLIELRRIIPRVTSASEENFRQLVPEFDRIILAWKQIGPVPEDQEDAIERIFERYCGEYEQATQRFVPEEPEVQEDLQIEEDEKQEIYTEPDEIVTLKVKSISFPFRVITEGCDGYSAGVLFPEYVTFQGAPISVEWSRILLSKEIHIGDQLKFSVKKNLSVNGFAVLGYEISTVHTSLNESYDAINVGDVQPVSIVGETVNYYLVMMVSSPLLGIVLKSSISPETDADKDGNYNLQLMEKGDGPLHLLVFVKPAVIEKEQERTDIEERISGFLKQEELDVIGQEDLTLVKYMLETYPSIKRSNCSLLSCDIYCRIPDDNPMRVYLNSHPRFLEDRAFWVAFSREKETNAEVISLIHPSPTIVVEMRILDDNQFVVTKFDSEGSWETRNIIKFNNRKACLKVSASCLHFVSRYEAIPVDFSTAAVIDQIEKLSDFNTRILREIHGSIMERTTLSARDYTTLGNYLKYQRNQEKESAKEPRFIEPARLGPGSGATFGDVALRLELLPEDFDYLLTEEEDNVNGLHVAIVDRYGMTELLTGTLREDEEYTYLDFNHGHIKMESLLSEGIYLRRRVNTHHLDIQIGALDGFVKNDSLGLYQDLINGRLEATDTAEYEEIDYFNPIFNEAGEDNNQPKAVKKALANKNLLLIQGPPGTGKTTIIVEIINQLAREGKKVLVCSQAHAAVANIYDRLDQKNLDILRLDDRDDIENVSIEFDRSVYTDFLKNSSEVVRMVITKKEPEEIRKFIDGLVYAGGDKELTARFIAMHRHILTFYQDQGPLDASKVQNILSNLEEETANITGIMLQAQMYRTKDVIMGTCIGVGMDRALRSRAVRFDTVIIDEAGKANLAETIVPMQLGKRFVLVGDHRQLPPFIDRQEVAEYVLSNNDGEDDNSQKRTEHEEHDVLDVRTVVSSLSNSLFADFYEHANFPEENKITLNYQFRMNPKIGEYISNLFYQGVLKSGPGTEKQSVYVDGFPAAVTFVDTTTSSYDPANNPKESSTREGSYYNEMEISIICNDVLPVIQKTLEVEPDIKLGIITPYKTQYIRLKSRLANTDFSGCVHTIDSIQGSEFDIVIFSFVRSFSKKSGKTVGFLDDMRRLNVSLSRAKKKLILVGNLNTLKRPEAHNDYGIEGMVSPVAVFKSIAGIVKKFGNASDFEVFMSSVPEAGTIFRDCPCNVIEGRVVFDISVSGRSLRFSMPRPRDWQDEETIDIVYSGIKERDGKPMFFCADKEVFAETHQLGETFDGIIDNVGEDKQGHQLVFVKVDGVIGLLNEIGSQGHSFTAGEEIKVEFKSFNREKRRISFAIPLSMAETVFHSMRCLKKFDAVVTEKFDFPEMKLEFQDDSVLRIKCPLLWNISKEGVAYELVKFDNGSYQIDAAYFYDFIQRHSEGDSLLGEVLSEDDFQFYVEIDGAYAVVKKHYLKGRNLFPGEKRMFTVFRFDDKKKSIQLGL